MRRVATFSFVLTVFAGVGCGGSEAPRGEPPPLDDAPDETQEAAEVEDDASRIEALAAPLVEEEWLVGLSVGWVAGGERGTVGFGEVARGRGETPDQDTLFEIGSITKGLMGSALGVMAERGKVDLDTPAGELLSDIDVPAEGEQAVTLRHLATHTSGLPRLPDNLVAPHADDPYADYSREDLAAFFEEYDGTAAPGEQYRYSNLGAGLFGEALAEAAGQPFDRMLRETLFEPLGMVDTAVRLGDDQAGRLATGYAEGDEVPPWTFDALAGAGALRSTVSDLLTFIEAHFSADDETIAAGLAKASEAQTQIPDGDWVALGWHVGLEARGGSPGVVWHNGGTGGFHSFLAFDPDREVGVVVLANSMQPTVERLGMAVMDVLRGDEPDFEVPRRVSVDRDTLDRYEGIYELAPGLEIVVAREGRHLVASVTGQPRYPVYPSSETEFFYRVVDASIEFHVGAGGEVEGLTLHQGEVGQPAERTSDDPGVMRPDIDVVELDDAFMDRYVGVYRIDDDTDLEISRTDEGLVAGVPGQPAVPIAPISRQTFIAPQIGAELSFVVTDDDAVEAVIIRQGGGEQEAPKIE